MILKTQIPQSTQRTPSSVASPTKTPQVTPPAKVHVVQTGFALPESRVLSPRGRASLPEDLLGTLTCGNACHPQPTTFSSAGLYALTFAFLPPQTGSMAVRLHADFPSLFMSCRRCFNLTIFVYLSVTFSDSVPRDNFPKIIIKKKKKE